jgi:hypothetical protein
MKKIIFFLLLFPLVVTSAPTPEGLFKNNSNKNLEGEGVAFNIKVKLSNLSDEEIGEKEGKDISNNEIRLKLVLNKNNDTYSLIQMLYVREKNKDVLVSVIGIERYENLLEKVKNDNSMVFYSLLPLFGFNESKYIFSFLKSKESRLKSNSELINPNKQKLLESYYDYLSKKSENPNLVNPLISENTEEKQKINEVMSSPYYITDNEFVHLTRKNNKFYWILKVDDKEIAVVEKETMRLLTLSFVTEQSGLVVLKLGKAQVFKNNYVVPSSLELSGDLFKLELDIEAFSVLGTNSKKYVDRLKEYNALLKNDKIDLESSANELLRAGLFVY